MPVKLSADIHVQQHERGEGETTAGASVVAAPVFEMTVAQRGAMIGMAYIPLLHACAVVVPFLLWLVGAQPAWWLLIAVCNLYLLPPLVARVFTWRRPLIAGDHSVGSKMFFRWWFVAQWQVMFNRLPIVEEMLRIVPGVYSAWLRLWGSKIGPFVYWAPGVVVLDRSLIEVGPRVVTGVGARLHGHVISRSGAQGRLTLGVVRVDRDALIGGLTLLTAGTHIHESEMLPALKALPPFTTWRGGRRVRNASNLEVSE